MQTSDLINFINGNKDITQKDIDELVALANKYPYFETFYNIILRGVKKIEKNNLDGIIQKFSIYIVDRKKMMNDLFLIDKKVIKKAETTNNNSIRENIISTDDLKNNKKTQDKTSDAELAFYERQKKKHESVLRDFFVQRVKKMTKISELLGSEDVGGGKAESSSDKLIKKVEEIKKFEPVKESVEPVKEIVEPVKEIVEPEIPKSKNVIKSDSKQEVEDDILSRIENLKRGRTEVAVPISISTIDNNQQNPQIEQVEKEQIISKDTLIKEEQLPEQNIEITEEVHQEKEQLAKKNIEIAEEVDQEKEQLAERNIEITEEVHQEDKKEESEQNDDLTQNKDIISKDVLVKEEVKEQTFNEANLDEQIHQQTKDEELDEESGFLMLEDDESEDIKKEEEPKIKSAADAILERLRNRKKSYSKDIKTDSTKKVSAEDFLNKLRNKTRDEDFDLTDDKKVDKTEQQKPEQSIEIGDKEEISQELGIENTSEIEDQEEISQELENESGVSLEIEDQEEISQELGNESGVSLEIEDQEEIDIEIQQEEENDRQEHVWEIENEDNEVVSDKNDKQETYESAMPDWEITKQESYEEQEEIEELPEQESKEKEQEESSEKVPEGKIEESENKEPKTAAERILERIQMRKKSSQQDIIDNFIEKQPSLDRKKIPEVEVDLAKDNVKEVEIVTERLAEIYALQGLNDKAIETYQKLILKYPEKRTYFAQKIEELKKKL